MTNGEKATTSHPQALRNPGRRRAALRLAAASPLALTIALAAAQAASAQAAPAATSHNTSLEEVVVTARKVSENLQEVPVSVTALSGKQLTQTNAQRLTDLASSVPGFSSRPATSPVDAPSFEIRGQTQSNDLATVDAAVGVYVDGVYWARAYGINADLLDAKDAQVLRGPQGTLFGRNTTGGAVLLETNDPNLNKFTGEVAGSYGNYNYVQGRAIINVPLVNDTLAARVAIQRTAQDGYQPLLTAPSVKDGSQNNLSARAKILWKPTDSTSILLSADYYWANFHMAAFNLGFYPSTSAAPFEAAAESGGGAACVAGFGFAAPPSCAVQGNQILQADIQRYLHSDIADSSIPNQQREKTQTYSLTVTQDTPVGQAKLIAGYRRVDMDSINNYGGSQFVLGYFNAFQDLYEWSLEGQLTGKALDQKLSYATGVFYFNETGRDGSLFQGFQQYYLDNLGFGDVQYLGQISNRSVGVYGQATYDFTDKLSLTEGLRWSYENKGVTVDNGLWSGGTVEQTVGTFTCTSYPSGCGGRLGTNNSNVSYLLDLDYKFTPHVMAYAKTARGYRSGGVNLREVSSVAGFAPNIFKPEQATEYEIGLKSQFWDNRVRLNIDYYYTIVRNIQRTFTVTGANGVATTFEGNAGEADVDGFEAELAVKAWQTADQSLTLNLAASDTNPWYVSYKNPINGFDQSHEKFDSIPKTEVDVGATYTHDFELGKLTLNAIYSWESGYPSYLFNYYLVGGVPTDASQKGLTYTLADAQGQLDALKSPAGGVLNLRATFDFDEARYQLAVWGRNVADNRDIISAAYIGGDYTSDMRRPPAMYGFTVTAHF
jgi:iron complex outermembrane receptor protein